MKLYILSLFISVTIVTMTTSVLAQDADPCAKVTCSNHGDCVFVEGRPLCACHEGYEADSVGLGCKPVAQHPKVKECSSDKNCPGPDFCYEGECVSKAEKRKKKRKAKRDAAWASLTPFELAKKRKKSKDMIVSGSIILSLGVVSAALGTTLAAVGVNMCEEREIEDGADVYWDDGCSDNKSRRANGMFVSGWIMAPVGGVLLIPGALVLALGVVDKKRLARNESTIGFNPAWTDHSVRNFTPSEWKKKKKQSRDMIIAGSVLTAAGGLTIGAGIISDPTGMDGPMMFLGSIGMGALAISIPVLSVGLKRKKRVLAARSTSALKIPTRHGKLTLKPTFATDKNGLVIGLAGQF